MADRAEPELHQEPADILKGAGPPAESGSNLEVSAPMLDVHAPHQAIHAWKDFLVHIVAITIGLLIAIGLEQTVEYVHHRHQRETIEQQMRMVFSDNVSSDAEDLKRLASMRAALAALRSDIEGRLRERNHDTTATLSGNLIATQIVVTPSMAPYESAKENGTVALLPVARIRIYNRLYFQRQLLVTILQNWQSSTTALAEFSERFKDFPASADLGTPLVLPELDTLRPTDLEEYLRLVATSIKRTDLAASRIALFDAECQVVLEGVPDEATLMERTFHLANLPGRSIP
jgi:hypothetical protein